MSIPVCQTLVLPRRVMLGLGSRSTESAQKFIDAYINGDKNVKAYGSYAEVFADKVRGMEQSASQLLADSGR